VQKVQGMMLAKVQGRGGAGAVQVVQGGAGGAMLYLA